MTYFTAKNSFNNWLEHYFLLRKSRWIIKEFRKGDVRVYDKVNLFGLFPLIDDVAYGYFTSVEEACAWCAEQIEGSEPVSTIYVTED